jgi:hypothetical protein
MHQDRVEIAEETGAKRTFVWAVDWPGWCRGGKDAALAIDALIDHGPRYAIVAKDAGLELGDVSAHDLFTVESVPGGSGTDFGVPSTIGELDRRPTTDEEAARLARLVEAAWIEFERVAASAPAELRKGPRGGGRDRDKMIGHVNESDGYYAREMGVHQKQPDTTDHALVEATRTAMLDVLRRPSDGSPLAGRKWTARYAARRIAWHALDHAWEMEDRSSDG